jgi:hypothetical protein
MFESCYFELLGGQEAPLLHMREHILATRSSRVALDPSDVKRHLCNIFENLHLSDCEVRAIDQTRKQVYDETFPASIIDSSCLSEPSSNYISRTAKYVQFIFILVQVRSGISAGA